MDLKNSGIKIGQQGNMNYEIIEDINFQRTKELRNLMKDGKRFFRIFT